jgi:hypothetical protein
VCIFQLAIGNLLGVVIKIFLGVPMIVILKVVAERLEGFEFIAELLAD